MYRDIQYECETCLERTVLVTGRTDPGKELCDTCGWDRYPIKDQRSAVLKPCPFCGGPPVPFLRNTTTRAPLDFKEIVAADDGIFASALVFCHECGCDGPAIEGLVFSVGGAQRLRDGAVRRWQERGGDGRSMECYTVEQAKYQFAETQEDEEEPQSDT
jgi:hypothetical protein